MQNNILVEEDLDLDDFTHSLGIDSHDTDPHTHSKNIYTWQRKEMQI